MILNVDERQNVINIKIWRISLKPVESNCQTFSTEEDQSKGRTPRGLLKEDESGKTMWVIAVVASCSIHGDLGRFEVQRFYISSKVGVIKEIKMKGGKGRHWRMWRWKRKVI